MYLGSGPTPGPRTLTACVHHPFERQAERTPDAVAVVAGEVETTYRELEERANRLARTLLRRGAGPEVRVGICVERSAELVVGLLGILKAGSAYVPLDPAYPRERIAATLRAARAPLLVSQERFRPLLDGYGGEVVRLDAGREEIARECADRPPCRAGSGNTAYLIYTSGSTGTPKGVVIEHRSAAALLEWCREAWPAEECAGVLGSTSVCFDMSVFEVFHTLAVGGTLVLAENALALPHLPARERVTLVNTVPSAAAELLRSGGIPGSVRVVNLGGEPLPDSLAQGLYALGHVEKVWNLYGPTEDTTYSTFHRVVRGAGTEPPVGRAVPGTRIHLLDASLDPVADGEVGEVYLAGDGLARGYLDRPELTAERFLPDVLGPAPGARMYRVGDLGRLRSDGELEYLGRVDHQVKIRGFRVELGEVESALRTCPGVAEAVVAAREDGSGDRRLVAYVVGGAGSPRPTAGEMREHLRERLPDYMVPAALVALDRLPLLPNGKLDRGALPEPDLRSASGAEYVAPRTPLEERLAAIWAEVLGAERIGIHDSFFELGGHSLRAAQVIARVRTAFGVELPMAALFDAPTVAELADRVSAGEASPELPPLVPAPRDRPLPLSLSQEAIWFFQKLAPGMRSYNFQATIRFRGALDAEALERTFTEIARRHEIFRTTFPEVDGQPVQVVHPHAPVPLPRADLRGLAPDEQAEEVARHTREEFGAPFDLDRLPLVRWRLLRLAEDEHLLLQVEHHFVHDGWSFGVFLRELAAIYPAFARGEPSPLAELPVQFADFAVWHREVMRGERARADLEYWREELTGADPTLDLPTDRPRPPAMSFRGSALRTRVPPRLALAARAFAQRSGATLYMTLLAGFEALLHRYTGQEDFCVGGAVANRSWKETEPLIGMIVNTVAFRARLRGVRSFRELAEQVKETTRRGYAHKDVHFGQVVEAVQPERNLSRLPVYQVAFGSHDSPYPDFGLPGVSLEVTEALNNGSAKFELSVVVMPRAEMRPGAPEDEIEAVWEFATDLFEESTVERMVRRYHALLEALLADPEASFREVPLLDGAERRQLLEWGSGGEGSGADACLHELVEAWARRTPGAPAVAHGDTVVSYAELDARATALADELRARGIAPEVPVGVCLERGIDAVAALLAVLKAGGVYVPLDPAYPADRLASMLADAAVPLVLTSTRFVAALPQLDGGVLLLDRAAAPSRAPVAALPADPRSLAYVVYTSGSTGTPKGVMVTHRAAAGVISSAVGIFGARPESRVAHTASLSFDASLLEIFLALGSGAALHVADRDTVLSAEALGALLRDDGIDVWVSTPALLELLGDEELPALRSVSTGGERCPGELAARWSRGRRLMNMYGPTETAIIATSHPCREDVEGAPPIGRPVAGTRAYVLDAALQPVPVGIPGELYLGGEGVARGYLGRPELTAERFVPDALSGEAGARLYRTGDRARWLAGGELEFLGRVDEQVKIRGLRIEPGEIEAALLAQPGVRAAVVAVREDAPGRRTLVGYAVADEGVTAAELRDAVRRRLPEYMVPAAVVLLDALPLTPTGKLDRRALPAPEVTGDGYAAPRTPTEEVVAGIFAEVLGRERVGAHEDFFELGGHSLLATRVAARILPAFGVEIPVCALFEAPTVAGLAAHVDAERRGSEGTALPPLVPVSREGPLPLSFAQQRLWFIHRMDPQSGAYNVPLALRLRGALDARVLERALSEIVRRHEALRTVFEEHGGEPVQVVRPAGAAPLPAVDLSGLPEGAREAHARRLVRDEVRRPFDLRRGPLMRTRLLRLSPEEHVVVMSMHHVVTDGWSMGVLLREIAALYEAFVRGASSPLPELPVQYADYAVWQRGWLAGDVLERQLDWWRDRLAGAPPVLEIPVDRPRRPLPGERGASLARTLPRQVAAGVRALARGEGATLYMVLLAALDVLLARWSGQDDVVVGTPIANRHRVETEGVIGFLVNTLALRTGLGGNPAFGELLARVRETTLGAYQHQDLPFEKLVEELGVERSLGHTPLFQAVFLLDDGAAAPRPFGGMEVEDFGAAAGSVKFDLRFAAADRAGGFELELAYREELWEAATMERLLDGYLLLLESVAAEPDRRVLDLPLLREAERERVLAASRGEHHAVVGDLCVHDLVAAQAARTPGAPALVHADTVLTYDDLERAANRLANHLRRLGVAPETRVGVCLEREVGLVVALLAVLKAGGAYVPLDPAYPRERLASMQEDAEVSLALTSRRLAGVLPEGMRVLALDDARAAIEAESDAAPESGVLPENLSHVIFTSGSTGRPKGVMIRHASVVVLLHWLRENIGDDERSSVLFSTSVNFDVSVAEVFGTLAWGGKLVVVENALELATLREEVVYASMVPAAAAELLRTGAIPASVRTLNLGGEPLPSDLAQALYAAGVEKVGNLYGPTEDTTYSTYSLVERGGSRVTIGRPVANTQALVLDGELRPVPTGVAGELYLAGDGVSRGYARGPELTAERFLPNRYGPAGSRMYRVMDRVRWTAAGELEYFGRTDFQVKVRGFRIEPGEIEAALRLVPGVLDAVVVAREDTPGDLRLVAYLAADPAVPLPGAAEIGARLRERLPEYMAPSAFVVLEELPRTLSGKVDRRALPAPGAMELEGFAAPCTPVEEVVAGIWVAVLGVARVGRDDSFFELGGHSLLATRVAARVGEIFGTELPVRALFEAPTVAELSRLVERLRDDATARTRLPPLVPVGRDRPLPLSFAQQRLWFIHRLEPESSAYNVPLALRLRGALDPRSLEHALREIVRRHEALRTTFDEAGGEPVQVVHPAGAVALAPVDLSALAAEAREAEMRRVTREEMWRPFDLARGPLFRARLLRLSGEEHVLLLNLHHVAGDGWSLGILLREMASLYGALTRREPPPLPEPEVQYADFAVWQREWLTGEVLERQLAWWRDRLAGAPPLLELPTDHPRRPISGATVASVDRQLPPDAAERVRALARDEGASPFMVLLAALDVLLARWSGQDDVVVGTAIANRHRVETEGVIGFFANTLAIRADLSGEPTFPELVKRVRETALGAYAHQDLPFERLVEELGTGRSLSHTPLFQVSFQVDDGTDAPRSFAAVGVEPLRAVGMPAKLDLAVVVSDTGEGLGIRMHFREDLWDASTRERVADAFATLLEEIAAEPGRSIAELPLVSVAERERMLREWGTGPAAHPPVRLLHERFGEQAARTPDTPAVAHGGEVVSYAELDARAAALAAELRARGVGPEVPVGVCLERGIDAVVALLAVFRAGGVYVPLDPAYPAARLAFMLADSGARLVLTAAPFAGSLPEFAGEVLRVDDFPPGGEIPARSAEPARAVAPENLAWVIYTSGSTGTPKGVMATHGSAANLVAEAVETFGTRVGSQVAHSASLSFDASILEIFGALLSGATLHVAGRDTVLSADAMASLLRERGVELWVCTPPMLELLADRDLPALRSISIGGDRCSAELAARWSRRVRMMNMYGPTETTIYTIWHPCRPGAEEAPPIGRPVAGARAYVLDSALQPVPAGMPGELYVGGVGVARGYLGRPELTAGKFVPDPFGAEAGARLYRTGDRARWRDDGELEFLGRVDGQVKIRGVRIEPGEIEAALVAHPAVREAVVVVRDGASGLAVDRRLVAYVVPAEYGTASAAELRGHLRTRLPDYMVPSAIVPLGALPLTPTGKLDRRTLPEPEASEDACTAPRTPVEEVVAGIFAEVLGEDRVGAHDGFFERGGHSLLATRVASRVAALLGVEIPLRALFEAQTVAELAACIDAERRAGEGVALPPLVAVDRSGPLPLSFAQERLWFLHQMDPHGAGYNMPFPSRVVGPLAVRALGRALDALVRRHDSLRTTFRPVDGGAVQVVCAVPAAPARIPVADLSGLDPEAREREARRLAEEDALHPFDLEHGPLLRLALLRLGDAEHVMLLCMHHIVSDGWSMGVLFRELYVLYSACSRGEAPRLPAPAVQYGDYAVWQRGWLAGDVLRRQLDWWRERLGGSPPALELPTDRPRPVVASGRGASLVFRVPAGETLALRALARREGATLYMVARAALDVLLARWSGQEDLVVGSPIAGRTRVELEGLIGFFVNTLALRTDLSGDPTFTELLGRVRETALGAYAHQDLPFERLVEEIAPERSLSHTPLFQVMFALQNAHGGAIPALSGLRVEPFRSALRAARFDLELDLREEGEELLGGLRFRTDLFDPATVERFAAQYCALLASAGTSAGERCSRLRLLPEEEVRLLLAYGSGPGHRTPAGGSVPRLLTAQAARTPDAVAVLSGDETLTFAQLDRRAATLARRLRRHGAAAGATVAVCVERGPGLLVALRAIWKAGGVYLPLDPGYPAERLSFLLRDSGAELVLTEAHLAGMLPEHGAGVVLLDTFDDEEPGEPDAEVSPDELAYLIYTSGSTGTPKAVMVEHAQLAHTLRGALDALGLGGGDVVAALASVAFDISLLELLAPLLAGAATRIVPREVVRDPAELVAACADATVLHAVPALMRQVVEAVRGTPAFPRLRLLLVGGDTVAPDLLDDLREAFPRAAVRVLYGPTEATIICATYAVPAAGGVAGHPLGHPLAGARLSVRGPRGETCPIGVPGEVWVSGGGVTRGYLDRPEMTAEKFVAVDGERAYRTGDRARWRPDGVLEFLGRTDEQVKVRGFRIEPGEVEAALREQPGVREAVVLAREDQPGDRRLVGYVVPEGADPSAGEAAAADQVAGWETLFEETYGESGAEADPTLNLTGWNSSYTGEPIPREEMREWVERTVDRVLALRPERVLEIGCGTGLLLFRVAPRVRAYHGTDFSRVALEHVRRSLGGLPQVTLSEREAADLDDLAGAGFDLVIINSVAQYFPGVDYLLRVLEGAAAALRPGGQIFVGDVRSLPLLAAFHASVELARAPGDLAAAQLGARVRRGISEEQELVVDPALFEALGARIPRIGRVEVQVKRGAYDNEVSRFRYDVVLHLDTAPSAAEEPLVRDWSGEDVAGVRALFEETPSPLLLRGIPDPRVREHARAARLLTGPGAPATAEEVRTLAAGTEDGVPREALFALGEALGRAVEVRPGAPGTLDVLLHPAGGGAVFPAAPTGERTWKSYANDPQWGRRVRALVPALRAGLRARLPEYMLPSAFVVLESFPVTPNGKVDRRALPAPDAGGARERAYAAPRSALEEALAGIWQEVLGVERVGIHDSFFDLGGHSLLATQLVARTRILRVEVPVRQVFQTPTVAGLAESITRTEPTPGATEMIAKVLLRLKTMSPGERAAALRAKQTGVGA